MTADSLYLSNIGVLVEGGDDSFSAPECAGRTCEIPGIGDFSLDEIDAGNYESQPVMIYGGISFGQRRSPGTDTDGESFEALGYGGWLDHHYFAINASLYPDTDNAEKVVLYSYVVGDETGNQSHLRRCDLERGCNRGRRQSAISRAPPAPGRC